MSGVSAGECPLSEGEIPTAEYGLHEGEAPIRRYLLGDLTPEERQQIEARLLTDDEFHERVGVTEDELLDEYLYGELPEDEGRRFVENLRSSPEQYRKLQLAEGLRARATGTQTTRADAVAVVTGEGSPWWHAPRAFLHLQNPVVGLSLALLLLLSMFGGLWLATKVRRLEGQLAQRGETPRLEARDREQALQQQLEQQSTRLDELTAELQRAQEQRASLEDEIAALKTQDAPRRPPVNDRRPAPTTSAVASLLLPLIQGRSVGESPTLNLSPDTARVELMLDLDVLNPADYKSFGAEVREVNGHTVWSGGKLSSRKRGGGNRVVLSLSAGRFVAGDYQVKLDGTTKSGRQEPIGIYYFRVQTNTPYAQDDRHNVILPTPTPQ